jgi:lysophospholipase L1-like esterase
MKTYFLLGDSISGHYYPYLREFLPEVALERRTDLAACYQDRPQCGNSSVMLQLLRRFAEEGFRPDLLIFNCGLHDIKTDIASGEKEVASETYRENLTLALDVIEASRIPLVWVSSTPVCEALHNRPGASVHRYEPDVRRYNAIAHDLMASRCVPEIDLHAFTQSMLAESIYCDHVHFTDAVRRLQAACLAGALRMLESTRAGENGP